MANTNMKAGVGYQPGSAQGDMNDIARRRADSRVGPMTDEETRKRYDDIRWKSKKEK